MSLKIRLPDDIEQKLNTVSRMEQRSKSAIAREAMEEYLQRNYPGESPYESGKELFGKYSSDKRNLSVDSENIFKEKVKNRHHEK